MLPGNQNKTWGIYATEDRSSGKDCFLCLNMVYIDAATYEQHLDLAAFT